MNIRYVGGPLNRRSFRGPSKQPPFRDAAGNVLTYEQGCSLTARRSRDEAARAAVYTYDGRHCTYTYVPRLFADVDTERIRLLLEHAAEHPEDARRVEADIRAIEERAA